MNRVPARLSPAAAVLLMALTAGACSGTSSTAALITAPTTEKARR